MTQTSTGKQLKLPLEPQIGDVDIDTRCIYGPDPWAWNASFNCWFSADVYFKEEGKLPDYVPTANREALGL